MDKKEAKKEIYSFLRKELKISAKDINKAYDYLWAISINSDTYTYTIFLEFSKDYVKYYIRDIPSKMCEANYTDIDKIKNNLKNMITALNIIARLN